MHPFLLSVFIFCIYFELIFKMKSVDNISANPRISIAGNAVPKKIVPTITIVRKPTITIISRCASILHGLKNTASTPPPISIAHAHTDSAGYFLRNGPGSTPLKQVVIASSIPMIRPFGEMYNAWIFPCVATRKIPAFIFRLFLCGLFPCTHFIHARYLCYTRRSYDLMRRILLLQCSRSSSLPMPYGLRNLQILFLLSECSPSHPEVS